LSLTLTAFLSVSFNFFAADEYNYMNIADYILKGTFFQSAESERMPLFYASLAGVFFVFGSSELNAKLFVLMLAILTCLFIYYLSKEILHDKKKAIFATAIFATNPFTIFFATRVLTEMMFCLFVTLIALTFIKSEKNDKILLITGFFIALLTLSRYVGLYAFFIIGVYWIFRKDWKSIFSIKPIYILTGFIIGLIPYFILNFIITGSPIGLIIDFFNGQFGVLQGTMSWPDRVPFYFLVIPFLIGTCSLLMWLFFIKNKSKESIQEKDNLFTIIFILGQWIPLEIFCLKSAALVRYMFGLTPFMAILSAKIIDTKFLEKIALVLIVLNLIIGLSATALFYSAYEKHKSYAFAGEYIKKSCKNYNSGIEFVLLHYTKEASIPLEKADCFVSSISDGGPKECPSDFELSKTFSDNKIIICKRKA
jgi:4-amino-4-deoxy-L-arabinose transferase-like glycosyltransferase